MCYATIFAMVSAITSLVSLSVHTANATEPVVVTGKKCTQGWECISTTPNDPPPPDGGPGDLGGGAGSGGGATIGDVARRAIDEFALTCKPAGATDQQYAAAQAALCVAKAAASVEQTFGAMALTALTVIGTQSACNARVADLMTAGVPPC
jgi:hypothetical protein